MGRYSVETRKENLSIYANSFESASEGIPIAFVNKEDDSNSINPVEVLALVVAGMRREASLLHRNARRDMRRIVLAHRQILVMLRDGPVISWKKAFPDA